MRRFSNALFCLTILTLALAVLPSALAQSQTVYDRIDQAMAHLSQYLGLNFTITRQTDYWRWEEVVYADSGLGCPASGTTYAATPNRAFHITITHDNVEYDYRVIGDGSLMVLCGASGQPLYRSDSTTSATAAPTQATISNNVTLPPAYWYAWTYLDGTDLLYLINPDGPQVVVKRPELTGEAGGAPGPNNLQMAISRNGRYLLEVVRLPSGNKALGLYDFLTGTLTQILTARANEDISLGWGTSGYSGSPLIFDANSQMAAVGFAMMDNPAANEWRIAIINLASGSVISQLRMSDVLFILSGGDANLQSALQGNGAFMPAPVYFDNSTGIHVQLIRLFTGGAESYPAFVWYPNTNTASASPYGRTGISIQPTNGIAVYSYYEPSLSALEPDGPFNSHNALGEGIPSGLTLSQQTLYTDSTRYHSSPQWAGNASQIIFQTGNSSSNMQWAMYSLSTPLLPAVILPGYLDMIGFSAGTLALAEGMDGFHVMLLQSASSGESIWIAPPMNGDLAFIWAQLINVSFSLSSVTLNRWAYLPGESAALPVSTTPAPSGIVHCPGTPPSQITTNINARVTYTTGTPSNVRQTPSTSAAVVQILPEGTQFRVIGGPQCANGYTWWQVQLSGATYGWMAEGDMESYFIEPAP